MAAMKVDQVYPLMILGAGPAGYTAAIYAARAGIETTLIRGPQPGGQLMITTDVENYPGFTKILGPDLMQHMADQALSVGVTFVEDWVKDVSFNPGHHTLYGAKGTYTAQAVIIATGAEAKWLGLPSETLFRGFGVSACATCDGPLFRDQVVAVVGGGNTAVEEALFLARHANKVYLIHRRDALRAEKILQKRLFDNPKIEVLWNRTLKEVLGQEVPYKAVQGALLGSTIDEGDLRLDIRGLFIAIGHAPNTGFLKGHLKLDEEGYIHHVSKDTSTEVAGVFAAGDVCDKVYRQAVTAAGQGCMAALDVSHYLS
jgi:thioredoxin reductase (NADPH)